MRIRRAAAPDSREAGFTLVELMVALTIIAGTLVALAFLMYGGMRALTAARQRSSMLEVTNAEMESLRALPWDSVGVLSTDPNLNTAYPSGVEPGTSRPYVSVPTGAPAAIQQVSTSAVEGTPLPYTIHRWITWDDPDGTGAQAVKHIDIQVDYSENHQVDRHIRLSSVLYPGGQGAGGASANQPPVAHMDVSWPGSPGSAIVAGSTVVNFDGTGSSDPDGVTLIMNWDFGDGVLAGGGTVTHTYLSAGSYNARLTVTDANGATASTNQTINVAGSSNTPPVAAFQITGTSDLSVNVVACPGSPCDADSNDVGLQYQWSWGDGTSTPFGTGAKSDGHTYAANGSYNITLTVKDTANATNSSAPQSVTVSGCGITGGSFQNPSTNATTNSIATDKNGKPNDTSFTWTATTTTACSALTATLPEANNKTVVFTLNLVSATGTTKTWTVTTSISNGDQFVVNTSGQTGFFTATGTSGTQPQSTFTFNVVGP